MSVEVASSTYINVAANVHLYQPPRWISKSTHRGQKPLYLPVPQTNGSLPADYNRGAAKRCYKQLVDGGVLERLNFDAGSTLLGWAEVHDPSLHSGIIESDKQSQKHYDGHGTALMLGSYNHVILPLSAKSGSYEGNGNQANSVKDIYTQAYWAKESFKRHFGREPEGAFLPEMVVDYDKKTNKSNTLKALIDNGIKFIVLDQTQVEAVRPLDGSSKTTEWIDTSDPDHMLDPTTPYKIILEDGSSIDVFFRDAQISKDVAFGKSGVYDSSERFNERWYSGQNRERTHNQILLLSTDAETFGEHFQDAQNILIGSVRLLSYGQIANLAQFLEHNPPKMEVRLKDGLTAWSCPHGAGHWGEEKNKDCTCYSLGGSQWRVNLRNAFNYARDNFDDLYQKFGKELFINPTDARNDYITVFSEQSSDHYVEILDRFLDKHLKSKNPEFKFLYGNTAYKLLEMQRTSQKMYTSCAWFWENPVRIEPYTNLIHADIALDLYEDITGDPRVREEFEKKLQEVDNSISQTNGHPTTVSIFKDIDKNVFRNPLVSPNANLII